MPKTVLQCQNLTIGYPQRAVYQDLTLSFFAGELVCLLGPNGAGKSTLMRTLAGMQAPLAGHVCLLGDDIQQLDVRDIAQRLSIVLTERLTPAFMTGYELVALGRHPHTDWTGAFTRTDHEMVHWAVAAIGAQDLARRPLHQLSDGERQKLMIARALAQDPQALLLDEPTAFLDLPRRVEAMHLLRQLAHQHQRCILLSTHDLDLALHYADRICLMPKGGTLQLGAPEDLVLNGAFAQAFASDEVYFDSQMGAFRSHQQYERQIELVGLGLRAQWTQRALERAGYQIGSQASLAVHVTSTEWQVQPASGDETQVAQSIYTLLELLDTLQL